MAELIVKKVEFKGQFEFHIITKPDGTSRKLMEVRKINEIGYLAKIKLK